MISCMHDLVNCAALTLSTSAGTVSLMAMGSLEPRYRRCRCKCGTLKLQDRSSVQCRCGGHVLTQEMEHGTGTGTQMGKWQIQKRSSPAFCWRYLGMSRKQYERMVYCYMNLRLPVVIKHGVWMYDQSWLFITLSTGYFGEANTKTISVGPVFVLYYQLLPSCDCFGNHFASTIMLLWLAAKIGERSSKSTVNAALIVIKDLKVWFRWRLIILVGILAPTKIPNYTIKINFRIQLRSSHSQLCQLTTSSSVRCAKLIQNWLPWHTK